jgi:hypothetical protein
LDGSVGRHIARIGVPGKSLSDKPFEKSVSLIVQFTWDNFTQLYGDVPVPRQKFSTAVSMRSTGGPIKDKFSPKVQLCERLLISSYRRELLCLAELRRETFENASVVESWVCADNELSQYPTEQKVMLICGEIDHFGNYTVILKEEVSALYRIVHAIVHDAADELGLSAYAVAAIIIFSLLAYCCLCTAGCCWFLRRRRLRHVRRDGADVELKSKGAEPLADDSSDEVAAFAALHGVPPDSADAAFEEADDVGLESTADHDASETESGTATRRKKHHTARRMHSATAAKTMRTMAQKKNKKSKNTPSKGE